MAELHLTAGKLVFALFLVVMNGVFVAAEFAFVRIRPTKVETLVEENRRFATIVEEAVDELDDYLAVSQVGITIASLALGWVGEPAVSALLEPVLGALLPESVVEAIAVALGFLVITFLHVTFGELAPKTFSIQDPTRIALAVAPLMKFFYYVFTPGIIVLNGTANEFTRLLGVPPASETEEAQSEGELRSAVSQSEEHGHIDPDEVNMIEGVFDLEETIAREVMVPRPDVVAVAADTTLAELREIAAKKRHMRYPVIESEGDRPIGFVHLKDVLTADVEHGNDADPTLDYESSIVGGSNVAGHDMIDSGGDEPVPTAQELARELMIVPEDRLLDDVLAGFQREDRQMAAVIDEWGSFEGVLTTEDVVEEIVGEIHDEFDDEGDEPTIHERPDGEYDIDGDVSIRSLNGTVGTDFESEEFETVGGLVFSRLGRAPRVDDRVELDGHDFRVTGVEDTRITSLTMAETDPDDDDDPVSESAGSKTD